MRKLGKILIVLCMAWAILITGVYPCMAAEPACKLTVLLKDGDGAPIDGFAVSICKIADLEDGTYQPAAGFENAGLSLAGLVSDPGAENARTLYKYIAEHRIPPQTAVSVGGKAAFSALDAGIWLVYGTDAAAHGFNPYLVFLPYAEDGELRYELTSEPKTDSNTPNGKSIYVVKRWADENNAAGKRPDRVTVDLKRDRKTVATAELSEQNGWAHTFTKLPHGGAYTVEERPVTAYAAEYNGDSENGFIITNTYSGEKLPQTGQYWWPIVILSVAGAGFILLGILELKGKKHETDTN